MKPKFKIGDKVRVCRREYRSNEYRFSFLDRMANLSGKVFEITSVIPAGLFRMMVIVIY